MIMKEKILVLDIETAPNWDVIHTLYPVPTPPVFDPYTVKVGTYKAGNPKIQEKIDAAALAHETSLLTWEDDHWAEIVEKRKVLLNPTLGCVHAVGWRWVGEEKTHIHMAPELTEADLIQSLALAIQECDVCIGFNLKQFDLPFLALRARVRGISWPNLMKGRYYKDHIVDMMEVLCSNTRNMVSLKCSAVAFGFPKCPDDTSGKEFWKETNAVTQQEYLTWDVEATAYLATHYEDVVSRALAGHPPIPDWTKEELGVIQ